jgi:hypothetical protein
MKKDEKGLIQNKNGSKGKTQELVKKKSQQGWKIFFLFSSVGTGALSQG